MPSTSRVALQFVAFEHVIAGDQIDRLAFGASPGDATRPRITPGSRCTSLWVCVSVSASSASSALAKPSRVGNRSIWLVGVRSIDAPTDAQAGRRSGTALDGLVASWYHFVQPTVRAEEVAVSALNTSTASSALSVTALRTIDRAVDVVVEAVATPGTRPRSSPRPLRGRVAPAVVRIPAGAVGRRLAREILGVGGRRWDRRRRGDRRWVGLALPHEA